MMEKIQILKERLAQDGFMIEGIVGSFAVGDNTPQSDIDLLYHVEKSFIQRYSGFRAFERLNEIKETLEKNLGREVDLIASRSLSETAKKMMLSRVIHV